MFLMKTMFNSHSERCCLSDVEPPTPKHGLARLLGSCPNAVMPSLERSSAAPGELVTHRWLGPRSVWDADLGSREAGEFAFPSVQAMLLFELAPR